MHVHSLSDTEHEQHMSSTIQDLALKSDPLYMKILYTRKICIRVSLTCTKSSTCVEAVRLCGVRGARA